MIYQLMKRRLMMMVLVNMSIYYVILKLEIVNEDSKTNADCFVSQSIQIKQYGDNNATSLLMCRVNI